MFLLHLLFVGSMNQPLKLKSSSIIHFSKKSRFDREQVRKIQNGVLILSPFGVREVLLQQNNALRILANPSQKPVADLPLDLISTDFRGKLTWRQSKASIHFLGPRVDAVYYKATDRFVFYSKHNQMLLAEAPHSRTFDPLSGKNHGPMTIDQTFFCQSGESYYGLGGHLRSWLDYRGADINLEQSNRENAMPFMVSSLGYGLMMNEPCGQQVSIDGNQEPIPSKDLITPSGEPGSLLGTYFNGINFETSVAKRKDSAFNFNWNGSPIKGLGQYNFSVRWQGKIYAPKTGTYRFMTTSDDGCRLFIDGSLVINDWSVQPATESMGVINLKKGLHNIKIEYFQAGGGSSFSLAWSPPTSKHEIKWKLDYAPESDYTFIYGPTAPDIIRTYRQLTGIAPLFGKWAYGFWQCKEHYNTQAELLGIASKFRRLHIPIDNIVQDWYYWVPHPWGSHQFDLTRYPDMKEGIADLHKMHFHFMISVWGKFEQGSSNYRALNKNGFLYPGQNDGFDGATIRYYDAFNPAARHLYWAQINQDLYHLGVDAWWLDASEPEISTQDFEKFHTYYGSAKKVLIAWPLLHTQGVDHGQLRQNPNRRVFILTRSCYLGQQRNSAAVWSGDIDGDWNTFQDSVSSGLNFCMAGMPYWTTDIGGFFSRSPSDPNYRELFTRWFEWGAFCPLFRVHGTGANKEPWRFGAKVQKILVSYDRLRYRLLPYIYSCAWNVTSKNGSIMLPLVAEFPRDKKDQNIGNEFMFGPNILVAPVVKKGAVSRSVYLPQGCNWFSFWSGKEIKPGSRHVDAPLDKLPLFIRAGSILPVGQKLLYSNQKKWNRFILRVYPGADANFTLYDDDGITNQYQKGSYSQIQLHWNNAIRLLTIGARQGKFTGMPKSLSITVGLVGKGTDWASGQIKKIQYTGSKVVVHL